MANPEVSRIFAYLADYHRHLREGLLTTRGGKDEWSKFNNCMNGSMMMALRDVGRFILDVDPEDSDTNPFGPEEDDY